MKIKLMKNTIKSQHPDLMSLGKRASVCSKILAYQNAEKRKQHKPKGVIWKTPQTT